MSARLKTSLSAFTLFCLALLSSVSLAQESQQTTPAESTDDCLQDPKCVELYEKARNLSKARQFQAAVLTYKSAYARQPVPWLLVNIGRVHQKMGQPKAAIDMYEMVLNDPLAAHDTELQSKVRLYLKQAEHEADAQSHVKRTSSPSVPVAVPSQANGETSTAKDVAASASDEHEDPCLQDDKCADLYEEARSLSELKQYDAALRTYQSAYGRRPVAWLLVNIGRVHHKMGHLEEAIATYKRFLAESPVPSDVELDHRTRRFLKQAEQELGALHPDRVVPARAVVAQSTQARFPIAGPILGGGALLLAIVGGSLLGISTSNYNSLAASCQPFCLDEQVRSVQTMNSYGVGIMSLAAISSVATIIVLPLEFSRLRKHKQNSPIVALGLAGPALKVGGRL